MATNFSVSQTQESDDMQEMYCEECEKHDDKNITADGFCVDCVKFLCAGCLKYHRRYFKNHKVEDKINMPQDFFFEKCSAHPKELIKFYCFECENRACQECKNNDHQNCSNVSHLPTLVKDFKPSTSTELKDLKENLDKLSNNIKDTEKELKDKCVIIDSLESNAKATTKQYKDKLIETYTQKQQEISYNFNKEIDKTIAKLRKEREKLVKELAEKQSKFRVRISDVEKNIIKTVENSNVDFKTLKEKHLTLVNDLKKRSADLVHAQEMGQNCKLFLTMKLTKQSCEKLFQNMQELQNNYIYYFKVEPKLDSNPSIQSLETTTTFFSYKDKHESAEERTATFYSDINFKFIDYTSLCLLNENTLLAASYDSTLVIFKITNINTQCYGTIKMISKPWAITKVAKNKVAITFPIKRIIRMIKFSEPTSSVMYYHDIRVRDKCHGIAYSYNNFIVSNEFSSTVQILTMSGQIVRTIDTDSNGQPLFDTPRYLAVNPDNTTIYVSDCNSNTVTSMTFDGKVKAIYKDDQLKGPYQLTVDESGAVYVCGRWSHNVHHLSFDLTKVKILLNESNGIKQPVNVAHCKNNNKLYVGNFHGNIKVFNLSLE